jgi:hypothetical protein
MTISADLWQLPQSELTASITDKVETNFYSRCPPEKRPAFMKETPMHGVNVSSVRSQTSSIHRLEMLKMKNRDANRMWKRYVGAVLQITSMKFDGRIETETGKGTGITD